MRRNVRDAWPRWRRFSPSISDPYIVVGDDGRLSWIIDAYTSSDSYPYSAQPAWATSSQLHAQQREGRGGRLRWNGYVLCLRQRGPDSAAWRKIFPGLFKDASAMPAWLRAHVRYPELLLSLQAEVYGLYHMTDPEVFYNREDQWTVATETGIGERRRADRAGHAAELCADDAARRDGPGVR